MTRLHVRAETVLIGTLDEREDGGLRFAYEPAWLEHPQRFAISHSLPLRAAPFEAEADRFFGNLLPEGPVRLAVCRRLGISDDNDVALLRAIGHECAGALSIVEADAPTPTPPSYRRIDDDELATWASAGGYATAVGEDLRLSLAGAQDKLAVLVDGDGLSLPLHGAPSTHLLKLPNRDFAALPQNEALVLALARRVGLPAVETRLIRAGAAHALLVRRFDRTSAPLRRLHQEDLCQALGTDRRRKYEAEGGPSFARCFALVRDVAANPLVDARELLRWLAFCVAVGNRDNHAKNLALLRSETGRWTLAPFYDLACTTAYPRLSRRLGLAIGGRTDGGNLPAAAWEAEARSIGVKPAYVIGLVQEITDAIERELPIAFAMLAEQLVADEELVAFRQAITKCVRATRRGLAS